MLASKISSFGRQHQYVKSIVLFLSACMVWRCLVFWLDNHDTHSFRQLLSKDIVRKEHEETIVHFYRSAAYKAAPTDISLCAVSACDSVTRLQTLQTLLQQWQGPASVALYITHDNEVEHITRLYDEDPVLQRFVSLHLLFMPSVVHQSDLYGQYGVDAVFPVNSLRNLATRNTMTDLVLHVEPDFLLFPSHHQQYVDMFRAMDKLYAPPASSATSSSFSSLSSSFPTNTDLEDDSTINSPIGSSTNNNSRAGKVVYILPVFQVEEDEYLAKLRSSPFSSFPPPRGGASSSLSSSAAAAGSSRQQQEQRLSKMQIRPLFYDSASTLVQLAPKCPACQSAIDFDQWFQQDVALYSILYQDNFEPYMVQPASTKGGLPYNVDFNDPHLSKIVHTWELHCAGYKLVVLPDAFALRLLHPPPTNPAAVVSSFARQGPLPGYGRAVAGWRALRALRYPCVAEYEARKQKQRELERVLLRPDLGLGDPKSLSHHWFMKKKAEYAMDGITWTPLPYVSASTPAASSASTASQTVVPTPSSSASSSSTTKSSKRKKNKKSGGSSSSNNQANNKNALPKVVFFGKKKDQRR